MKVIYKGKDIPGFKNITPSEVKIFTNECDYEVFIADGNLIIEDRGSYGENSN